MKPKRRARRSRPAKIDISDQKYLRDVLAIVKRKSSY
jgi:hypothetical protein